MIKTKTVFKAHPETLEPVKLAFFQLTDKGKIFVKWFDSNFEKEMITTGLYTLETGIVKFSFEHGPIFFEALSTAFANSSRMWVEQD